VNTSVSSVADTQIRRGGPELAAGGRFRPTAQHWPLLRILSRPGDEVRDALEAWCQTFDPRLRVDGGTFRLLPMVFHRMMELEVEHPVRPLLKGVYRRSLVQNARIIQGAAPAVQALSDQGLNPVLLKGAALVANSTYPTLAARPMEDVDVYVKRESRDAAFAILEGLGWQTETPPAWVPFTHAASFLAPGGAAEIDLHWHALSAVRTPAADQVLMMGLRDGCGLDVAAAVPDPTALLLITLVHGARPNAEPPVRWIADALLLLQRDATAVDWGRVVDFACAQQTGLVLGRMLELLSTLAGDDVPPHVVQNLRELRLWPVERWERRFMDGDCSSLVTQLSDWIAQASSAHRTAPMPSLRFVQQRRAYWDVPWLLMPVVAATRLLRYAKKR
jgi:hypothetical protein